MEMDQHVTARGPQILVQTGCDSLNFTEGIHEWVVKISDVFAVTNQLLIFWLDVGIFERIIDDVLIKTSMFHCQVGLYTPSKWPALARNSSGTAALPWPLTLSRADTSKWTRSQTRAPGVSRLPRPC